MAIGAIHGYKGANGRAMDMWEQGELIVPTSHLLHPSSRQSTRLVPMPRP
jgi:hypothetical protein